MPRQAKKKQAPKRKRVARRRQNQSSDHATVKEIFEFATLQSGTGYTDMQLSLARFKRATQVARAYQEYRIKKVKYIFKPLLDTFASDNTGVGAGIPYLYAKVDKTGALSEFNTADQLREAGAKPRRFDDKTLMVSYTPAVLDYAYDRSNLTNAWARPINSPWLSTDGRNDTPSTTFNPWVVSSIDHLGLAWILDGGANKMGYQLEMEVHIEFRKALFVTATPAVDAEGKPIRPVDMQDLIEQSSAPLPPVAGA